MVEPTAEQIETYRRDGFLIVEQFLDAGSLDAGRERFAAVFATAVTSRASRLAGGAPIAPRHNTNSSR